MKNIIFIAPPNAGKGTHASIISDQYNLPHISTGSICREVAKRDDEVGRYVLDAMSNAKLIKDEIICLLVGERLQESDCDNGYILDGFPRTIEQAIEYDKTLEKIGKEIGVVIVIDINKETLLKRTTGRRICEKCGAIYNINFEELAPKNNSICDECGDTLVQRQDDNLETFEARYENYLETSKPLIDYYEKKGVVYHVDGDLPKEERTKIIDTIITGGNK